MVIIYSSFEGKRSIVKHIIKDVCMKRYWDANVLQNLRIS